MCYVLVGKGIAINSPYFKLLQVITLPQIPNTAVIAVIFKLSEIIPSLFCC